MPNALLVSPKNPVTFWSFDEALKMLGKASAFPPLGLLTIAGMLPEAFNLRLVDMNVRELTEDDFAWADIALTSSMIIHWKSLQEVIARCNAADVPVLNGGPLPTQYHKEIDGDGVFYLGEAENGFLDVVERMLAPSYPGGREYVDHRKEFRDLVATPLPRWDLVKMSEYSNMVVQITRGCPESCTFCNIPALYGKVTRVKTTSRIVAELNALFGAGWRGSVMAVDDNFVGNADAIRLALEEEVIPWQEERGYPFQFNTQSSIRVSDNPALLEAMYRAGFVKIFAGIESPVEKSLKFMGAQKNLQKNLQGTTTPLLEKVRILQQWGFEVQAGFIMGLDTDPPDIADCMLSFIREAGIPVAMVGPLGVLPDTADYKRFKRLGRLVEGVKYGGDSGVFSSELSFVPMVDHNAELGAEWLLGEHRRLVALLNSPEIFFERCLTMFQRRLSRPLLAKRPIGWPEVRATALSLWKQGITGNYRTEYWKYLGQVLWHHRRFLPDAIRLAVQGHHLIVTTEQALAVDEVKTFLDMAIAELEALVQGSREAVRRAEDSACRIMEQVSHRLRGAHEGAEALRHNANILLRTARKQCRALGRGFKDQVAEPFHRFERTIHRILEESSA